MPVAPITTTSAASAPAELRGVPVLIVDDNATNRHILEEWLRGYAMEPTTAGDGETAMAALWRGVAQGRPYPLVLLDRRMPDIDGLALAAKIRQQTELSATRLILLMWGDRLPASRSATFRLGDTMGRRPQSACSTPCGNDVRCPGAGHTRPDYLLCLGGFNVFPAARRLQIS